MRFVAATNPFTTFVVLCVTVACLLLLIFNGGASR